MKGTMQCGICGDMLSEVSHVVLPIGSRPGGSWGNNRDFLAPGPPLGDILPGEYDPGDV